MLETEPQLEANYVDKGQVRLVFKHYPLPSHDRADDAAEAAECASQQGKFWEMKKALYEKVEEWSGAQDPPATFEGYAKELGLDTSVFRTCLDSGAGRSRWQQDQALGQSAQIDGTPTFFIIRNADQTGVRIPGYIDYATFQKAIDQVLNAPAGQ